MPSSEALDRTMDQLVRQSCLAPNVLHIMRITKSVTISLPPKLAILRSKSNAVKRKERVRTRTAASPSWTLLELFASIQVPKAQRFY